LVKSLQDIKKDLKWMKICTIILSVGLFLSTLY
jgi:hypothetical protein